MKKIFIILVAFVCTLQTNMLFAQDITFRFPILNGEMSLEGTITLPENFSAETPVLILVSPPQASSRDYSRLFKSLADSLKIRGIASFRYDNRNLRQPRKTMNVSQCLTLPMMHIALSWL